MLVNQCVDKYSGLYRSSLKVNTCSKNTVANVNTVMVTLAVVLQTRTRDSCPICSTFDVGLANNNSSRVGVLRTNSVAIFLLKVFKTTNS